MSQPDRFAPWLALLALVTFALLLHLILPPLNLLAPRAPLAAGPAAPAASAQLPPAPAWPLGGHRPAVTVPSLSLPALAG